MGVFFFLLNLNSLMANPATERKLDNPPASSFYKSFLQKQDKFQFDHNVAMQWIGDSFSGYFRVWGPDKESYAINLTNFKRDNQQSTDNVDIYNLDGKLIGLKNGTYVQVLLYKKIQALQRLM